MNKQTLIIENATSITLDGVPMLDRSSEWDIYGYGPCDEWGAVLNAEIEEFREAYAKRGKTYRQAVEAVGSRLFVQLPDRDYTVDQVQQLIKNQSHTQVGMLMPDIKYDMCYLQGAIYGDRGIDHEATKAAGLSLSSHLCISTGHNGLLKTRKEVQGEVVLITGFLNKPLTSWREYEQYLMNVPRYYCERILPDYERAFRVNPGLVVGGPAAPGGAG